MFVALRLPSPVRRTAWVACFGIALASVGGVESAAAEITVTVTGGRTFTAEVDSRTDGDRLWLRFGTGRTTIQRPIEWPAVVSARLDGADVPVADLKQKFAAARPPVIQQPVLQQPATKQLVSPIATAPSSTPPIGGLQLWRPPGAESLAPPVVAPARSLAVDVYLANWDADVESDGIVVNFAALDDFGDPTPVDGTLEVELIGERHPPYSRGNAFPVLGRWVQAVSATDAVSPSGYQRVRLPFQAYHPDYWNSLPWFALAHVRLVVPGQGTFEASVDAVRLRGFTPVRDRMESASGSRFAPTEQTGRSKRLSSRGPTD